jgi:ABC-type multidrug transport system fused ATPase/permease subunit
MRTPDQTSWRKRRFIMAPLFAAGLFAMSAIVMLLWNAIIPNVTGALAVNFWQAMGLLVLCRILFGGFRFGGHHGHKPPFMHPSIKNKLMDMSDEEREQFKNQWKERFCK